MTEKYYTPKSRFTRRIVNGPGGMSSPPPRGPPPPTNKLAPNQLVVPPTAPAAPKFGTLIVKCLRGVVSCQHFGLMLLYFNRLIIISSPTMKILKFLSVHS